MPSSAECSLRANASMGTFRDTGSTATVFKFVLLRDSSVGSFLVDESISVLTRDAIICRILTRPGQAYVDRGRLYNYLLSSCSRIPVE